MTSWASKSASMTCAPSSARICITVDLPVAILPVSPIMYIGGIIPRLNCKLRLDSKFESSQKWMNGVIWRAEPHEQVYSQIVCFRQYSSDPQHTLPVAQRIVHRHQPAQPAEHYRRF